MCGMVNKEFVEQETDWFVDWFGLESEPPGVMQPFERPLHQRRRQAAAAQGRLAALC